MSVLKNCIGNNTRLLYTNDIYDTINLLCRDLQSKGDDDDDYDNIHLTDQLDVGPVSSWIDLDNHLINGSSIDNSSSSSSSSSSSGCDIGSLRTIKVPRKRYYLTNIEYSSLLNRNPTDMSGMSDVCRKDRDDIDNNGGVSTTIDDRGGDVKEVIEKLSRMIQQIKSTHRNKTAGGNKNNIHTTTIQVDDNNNNNDNNDDNNNNIDCKDGNATTNKNINKNADSNDDNNNDDKSNMLIIITSQVTIEPVLELLKKKRLCLKNSMSTMIWSATKELQLKELKKHNLAYLHATVI